MPDALAGLQRLTAQLANVSEALQIIDDPSGRVELLRKFRSLLSEADTLMSCELAQADKPEAAHEGAQQ